MTSTFLFSYLPYRAGSNRLLGSGGAAGHAHGGRDGQGGESNGVHGDGVKEVGVVVVCTEMTTAGAQLAQIRGRRD